MSAITFQEVARVLSERMLNGMAAGMLIAVFAWALLRLTGRKNSSTRFAVWFTALVAIATLPFLGHQASGAGWVNTVSSGSAIALPASWATCLFVVWAVITVIGLLRLAVGLWKLRRLRESAVALDFPAVDPLLRKTLEEFRSRRKVTLCVSAQQQVPAAIGFFKPLIVLPAWALHELSTAELNSILIHELAHLRRWDDWTNLVQKVLHAIFFFHPAVWWVERRLSLEREMACDDIVLSHTPNARAYAECLVAMAEKSFLRRSLALTQAAVSRMRQTSRRVAQILDADRLGATGVWKPALGLVTTFALLCGVFQMRAPELVAFRESAPTLETASMSSKPALRTVAFNAEPVASMPAQTKKASLPRPVPARKAVPPVAGPVAIEAKLNRPADAVPMQAEAAEPSATAQTMLVVFHGQQYSSSGQIQWTVWVWRVRVQSPVEARVPAKKT